MQPSTQEREILIDDTLSPKERFEMEMLTEVTDEISGYPEDELCFSRDEHDECNGHFRFFTDYDGNFYYFLYRREDWTEEWENVGHEYNIAGANADHRHVAEKVRDYMAENDTEENRLYIEGVRAKDFLESNRVSLSEEETLNEKALRRFRGIPAEMVVAGAKAQRLKEEEEVYKRMGNIEIPFPLELDEDDL